MDRTRLHIETTSDIPPAPSIPKNPFTGPAVVKPVPLREVWPLLNLTEMYKLSWGLKAHSAEEYQRLLKDEFEPLRLRMQDEALTKGIFEPKVVYGFWWAAQDKGALHIYGSPEAKKPLVTFRFPRQKVGRHLCLTDYFRPLGQGEGTSSPSSWPPWARRPPTTWSA